MLQNVFAATAELKFMGEPGLGLLGGYASVFGVMDLKGDIVERGAFDASLAEHKANGTMPRMFAEHSAYVGGDPLPIGKWTSIEPDEKGLRVTGKLIALDYPYVKRVWDLMREGEMCGLSIAFAPREGGVVRGSKPGDPQRWLKSVDLVSVDPVCQPANQLALIDSVKAMWQMPGNHAAAAALIKLREACDTCLKGGDAPTTDERQQIHGLINEAHRHITGNDLPEPEQKAKPDTIRLFTKALRSIFGYSETEAKAIAAGGFKALDRRDGGPAADSKAPDRRDGGRDANTMRALGELRSALSGFTLKTGT